MKLLSNDLSPEIRNMIHITAESDPCWKFPLHSHNEHLELSLVLCGSGVLYCSGRIFHIGKGDPIIKNAGVLHAENSVRTDPLEQICFSISGIHAKGLPPNHLLPDMEVPVIQSGQTFPVLREQISFLLKHYQKEERQYKDVVQKMLQSILSLVCLLTADRNEAKNEKSHPENIEKIISYINENYTKRLSLEYLSRKFFSTPGYLSRKFKEVTGYTVNQYIINCRMGEAERLLLFEKNVIKDVAIRCGYSDLQYFYRTFKKYTGYTPLEFQQKYRCPDLYP